jgi:hypothetical protein
MNATPPRIASKEEMTTMNNSIAGISLASILSDEELAELRRLFGEELLSAQNGLHRKGKLVRAVLSVWDSGAAADRFDAHLTVFDARNQRVRLDGVILLALARGETRLGEEVAQGDLAIKGLLRALTYVLWFGTLESLSG